MTADRSKNANSGEHVVVTGGSRGIGFAIAREFAQSGATVTILARDARKLKESTEVLTREALTKGTGTSVFGYVADVTDEKQVQTVFQELKKHSGEVTILVNNAGGAESAPFGRTDRALWDRMLSLNLTSAYLCTQEVLPAMIAAKRGRIVNVASTAGVNGYAYVTAYCAAKHALVGLTRALAIETAKSGVTVNAVCPGFTETEMLARSAKIAGEKTGRSEQEIRSEYLKTNPQGRFIEPEEVAKTVVWLCRPEQRSITGQAIVIAGGEILT